MQNRGAIVNNSHYAKQRKFTIGELAHIHVALIIAANTYDTDAVAIRKSPRVAQSFASWARLARELANEIETWGSVEPRPNYDRQKL